MIIFSLNILRNLYQGIDMVSTEYPHLLNRQHHEDYTLRQFFEKDGHLVKIHSPLTYMVTANENLEPYANSSDVESTKSQILPNLEPLNCLSYFFENHVYQKENNFPFKENVKQVCSVLPQVHTAFEVNSSITSEMRLDQDIYGRSLIMAFATTLGQARLNYGPNVSGVLPKPITLHFINTDGKNFHFSVFQLNTLDLEGDVKNVFWHQPSILKMFEKCGYIDSCPTLEGYDHNVFCHILSMYL